MNESTLKDHGFELLKLLSGDVFAWTGVWFCFCSCYSVRVKNSFPKVDDLSGDTKLESDFYGAEASVEPFKGEGSTFFKLGFGQA